jgi:hypothetical protein
MKYGVDQGRRGWLAKGDVLNTMTHSQFETWLKERRRSVDKSRSAQ